MILLQQKSNYCVRINVIPILFQEYDYNPGASDEGMGRWGLWAVSSLRWAGTLYSVAGKPREEVTRENRGGKFLPTDFHGLTRMEDG